MNFSLVRWLRGNRAASDTWPAEHSERLVATLKASRTETLYPDTAMNPWTARYPDLCVPGDPCRIVFSNEADRGEWHDCDNHKPRGRHRAEVPEYSGPPVLAVVTDVKERGDA